jgi:hypothetical protein
MENFYAAARRHFDAADLLYQSGAQAIEASHLYAYAAECVLKGVLVNQRQSNIRCHINDHLLPQGRSKPRVDLVAEYQNLQTGRGAKPLPRRCDWFKGWTIEARYSDGSEISAHLATHKQDAEVFRKFLSAANPVNAI